MLFLLRKYTRKIYLTITVLLIPAGLLVGFTSGPGGGLVVFFVWYYMGIAWLALTLFTGLFEAFVYFQLRHQNQDTNSNVDSNQMVRYNNAQKSRPFATALATVFGFLFVIVVIAIVVVTLDFIGIIDF